MNRIKLFRGVWRFRYFTLSKSNVPFIERCSSSKSLIAKIKIKQNLTDEIWVPPPSIRLLDKTVPSLGGSQASPDFSKLYLLKNTLLYFKSDEYKVIYYLKVIQMQPFYEKYGLFVSFYFSPYLWYGRKIFLPPRAFFYVYLSFVRLRPILMTWTFKAFLIVNYKRFAVKCKWNSAIYLIPKKIRFLKQKFEKRLDFLYRGKVTNLPYNVYKTVLFFENVFFSPIFRVFAKKISNWEELNKFWRMQVRIFSEHFF